MKYENSEEISFLNDFQKRVLEDILDKNKDLIIVPPRCGKTWLYNVLGLSYIYTNFYME